MRRRNFAELIISTMRIGCERGRLEHLEERLRPFLVLWIVIAVAGIYFHW